LIATEHWLSIGIIANEPSECWQSLGRGLHIDNPFDDPTHIVGGLDCPMKLNRVLPGVASDRSRVHMSSVFGQIIEADAAFP
jgi:hypothetical protein